VIFTSNAILLLGKYHAQPETMLVSMGFFLMTLPVKKPVKHTLLCNMPTGWAIL
jgi:hypothetical protein